MGLTAGCANSRYSDVCAVWLKWRPTYTAVTGMRHNGVHWRIAGRALACGTDCDDSEYCRKPASTGHIYVGGHDYQQLDCIGHGAFSHRSGNKTHFARLVFTRYLFTVCAGFCFYGHIVGNGRHAWSGANGHGRCFGYFIGAVRRRHCVGGLVWR